MIIDGGFYNRELGYPSMGKVLDSHIESSYIGGELFGVNLDISQKLFFFFLRIMLILGLLIIDRGLYG